MNTSDLRSFKYLFHKTEQHTQIRLNHWKNNFKKCFSNMWLKWWDSSNGHLECKCWHDSKMATKHKKVLCVLDFHATKFITIIQWGLQGSSIKKTSMHTFNLLSRVQMQLYCHVSIRIPSGHCWSYINSPVC